MFSKFMRRTHMYLALFLTPWLLGYALSTIVMNHNMGGPQTFIKEREQASSITFEPSTPPRQVGEQILAELHMEGAFGVQPPRPDGTLVINRQDLVAPRRITYSPGDKHLLVERIEFKNSQFLNRFHHRRGFQQPFAADRVMAWSVDVVVVALVFWAISGLWMWWEMRATRLWGLAAALFGIGIFVFFTLTI